MLQKPNIYQYLDYRVFLRDLYTYKKGTTPVFSYRFFSRMAGFRSSNFLKLVAEGERNLSYEAIQKFAKGLKLAKAEAQFFEVLVLFNQAKSIEEKNRHYEKITQFKNYNTAKPLEISQYAYFSNWYFIALRELVTLKNFREDPKWINHKLKTRFHPEEIKKAIQILLDLKLLYRDEKKRLCQTIEQITITQEMGMLAISNFYREMLQKANAAIEEANPEYRDISALTIAISKEEMMRIRERLTQFRREVHAIASGSKNREAVYQLNLQFFNLSEVPW